MASIREAGGRQLHQPASRIAATLSQQSLVKRSEVLWAETQKKEVEIWRCNTSQQMLRVQVVYTGQNPLICRHREGEGGREQAQGTADKQIRKRAETMKGRLKFKLRGNEFFCLCFPPTFFLTAAMTKICRLRGSNSSLTASFTCSIPSG